MRYFGRYIHCTFHPRWSIPHHLRSHTELLERVYRNAVGMIPVVSWNELRRDLPIVEERGIKGDMITIYEFLGGHEDINIELFFGVRRKSRKKESIMVDRQEKFTKGREEDLAIEIWKRETSLAKR